MIMAAPLFYGSRGWRGIVSNIPQPPCRYGLARSVRRRGWVYLKSAMRRDCVVSAIGAEQAAGLRIVLRNAKGGPGAMTPIEWQRHADQCREVAKTIEDATARRILMEAADDYAAMATRERAVTELKIPMYQVASAIDAAGAQRISH